MYGRHAAPISKDLSEALEKGTINLDSEESLDEFVEKLKGVQKNGRASSLNLLNINNGKNTLEFRLANGSTNPDVWIENTRLFGRIVQMAEKLAQIEKKEKLTKEEIELCKKMSKLKKEMPEEKKLEALLDLLFTEEEKEVYRDRYITNSNLLKELDKKKRGKEDESANPIGNLEFAKVVDFRHTKNEFEDIASKKQIGDIEGITGETRNGITNDDPYKGEK